MVISLSVSLNSLVMVLEMEIWAALQQLLRAEEAFYGCSWMGNWK